MKISSRVSRTRVTASRRSPSTYGWTTPLSIDIQGKGGAGNSAWCNFTVLVIGSRPPVLACPAINLRATVQDGANGSVPVHFHGLAAATDGYGATLKHTTADPPSGSWFDLGRTTVRVEASDAAGNTAECFFAVIVENEGTEDGTLSLDDRGAGGGGDLINGDATAANNNNNNNNNNNASAAAGDARGTEGVAAGVIVAVVVLVICAVAAIVVLRRKGGRLEAAHDIPATTTLANSYTNPVYGTPASAAAAAAGSTADVEYSSAIATATAGTAPRQQLQFVVPSEDGQMMVVQGDEDGEGYLQVGGALNDATC